jgi:hypothetical protein
VGPEEVAKAHEGSDRFDVCRNFCSFDGFQLVFAGLDSFRRQGESKVGYFFVAKYTFFQINLQVVLLEPLEYLFQGLEMPFMCVGMDQ